MKDMSSCDAAFLLCFLVWLGLVALPGVSDAQQRLRSERSTIAPQERALARRVSRALLAVQREERGAAQATDRRAVEAEIESLRDSLARLAAGPPLAPNAVLEVERALDLLSRRCERVEAGMASSRGARQRSVSRQFLRKLDALRAEVEQLLASPLDARAVLARHLVDRLAFERRGGLRAERGSRARRPIADSSVTPVAPTPAGEAPREESSR